CPVFRLLRTQLVSLANQLREKALHFTSHCGETPNPNRSQFGNPQSASLTTRAHVPKTPGDERQIANRLWTASIMRSHGSASQARITRLGRKGIFIDSNIPRCMPAKPIAHVERAQRLQKATGAPNSRTIATVIKTDANAREFKIGC